MNNVSALKEIDDFETHYKYDSTYMREILEYSMEGFEKFNNFLPLSSHIKNLSSEDYWVAKLAAMQVEDCGECLQLNVRMALEEGVSKEIIQAVLDGGNELSDNLQDVYHYALCVSKNDVVDADLMLRIKENYDKGSLLEFGICIATGAVFPTIKRAVGYAKSCSLIEIEV
jgi:alkylhydroperoxidase/carboxymuconolactone decarboxylase family protein YurZ